jgi:hypothetical protein
LDSAVEDFETWRSTLGSSAWFTAVVVSANA